VQHNMMPLDGRVRDEITPLVTALGFSLIDVTVFRGKGARQVKLVIYRPAGVSIEDCARVSRQIHPRLEIMEALGDCTLEVSSPGVGRRLKSPAEYEIFRGRGATVLVEGESEWRRGVIDHSDEKSLFLKHEGTVVEIPLSRIKQAKLAMLKEEGHHHVL
jgi:ribosome maturation factor RimP